MKIKNKKQYKIQSDYFVLILVNDYVVAEFLTGAADNAKI